VSGISAQLGCRVPVTLVHAGKYRTERQINSRDNTTWKKQCKTQITM